MTTTTTTTTTLVPKRQMRSADAAAGQKSRAATTVANIPHIYSKAKGHGYWLNPRELMECTVTVIIQLGKATKLKTIK